MGAVGRAFPPPGTENAAAVAAAVAATANC
jgi:hypothetical protein